MLGLVLAATGGDRSHPGAVLSGSTMCLGIRFYFTLTLNTISNLTILNNCGARVGHGGGASGGASWRRGGGGFTPTGRHPGGGRMRQVGGSLAKKLELVQQPGPGGDQRFLCIILKPLRYPSGFWPSAKGIGSPGTADRWPEALGPWGVWAGHWCAENIRGYLVKECRFFGSSASGSAGQGMAVPQEAMMYGRLADRIGPASAACRLAPKLMLALLAPVARSASGRLC